MSFKQTYGVHKPYYNFTIIKCYDKEDNLDLQISNENYKIGEIYNTKNKRGNMGKDGEGF